MTSLISELWNNDEINERIISMYEVIEIMSEANFRNYAIMTKVSTRQKYTE